MRRMLVYCCMVTLHEAGMVLLQEEDTHCGQGLYRWPFGTLKV